MEQDQVEELQNLTAALGELLIKINPGTNAEWDAFEKATTAHRLLRRIDTGSLYQLEFPLK